MSYSVIPAYGPGSIGMTEMICGSRIGSGMTRRKIQDDAEKGPE